MRIMDEMVGNNVAKVSLSGRMDIEGVGQIEQKFAEMSGPPRMGVIVDMSDVPYMSSIGIRALVMNAKSVNRRGGKFVIFSPQANVRNVLVTSGIDQIIRVFDDLETAASFVSA